MVEIKLKNMGVDCSLEGFRLLAEAIRIAGRKYPVICLGDIYNILADAYGSNYDRVARNIRYAIQTCSDSTLSKMAVKKFISNFIFEDRYEGIY